MNHYGLRIRDYWARVNPESFQQVEDPEVFFGEMGETMLTQVDALVPQLMGPTPADETFLQRVGRENAVRKQAEEIVWDDLVFVRPSTTPEEDREEWASTGSPVALLVEWADRVQDPETRQYEPSADSVAAEWLLPESFLNEMVASADPYRFVETDQAKVVLRQSEDARYRMFLESRANEE